MVLLLAWTSMVKQRSQQITYRIRRLRRAATALRLRFSRGVSKCRWYFTSAKIPAFETWRLNRRRAESIPSFSPRTTWVILAFSSNLQFNCSATLNFPLWRLATLKFYQVRNFCSLSLIRQQTTTKRKISLVAEYILPSLMLCFTFWLAPRK